MMAVQLASAALNTLLVPIAWGLVRFLWRVDRRLLVIETRLGIRPAPEA
jgi:hypothetical protein